MLKFKTILLFVLMSFFVVSCATQQNFNNILSKHLKDIDLNNKIKSGKYEKKIENLYIIIDRSGSMAYLENWKSKFFKSKIILYLINRAIPDLDIKTGIRIFGKDLWDMKTKTELSYGVSKHSKEEFENALNNINHASGKSPLSKAILESIYDLKKLNGKTAVIIVSDGKENIDNTLEAVNKLKHEFEDNICLYSLFVGDSKYGRLLMKKITENNCGGFYELDKLLSGEQLSEFLSKVFIKKSTDTDKDGIFDSLDKCPDTPANVKVNSSGCPIDSDNDSVYDYADNCPDTPDGVSVGKNGCPFDSDGDGIFDYLDKCPDTKTGITIDETGCEYKEYTQKIEEKQKPVIINVVDKDNDGIPDDIDLCKETPKGAKITKQGCWDIVNILFDFNKWDIKQFYFNALEEIKRVMKLNPNLVINLIGHTDAIGSDNYNKILSKKRSKATRDYLIKLGIKPERIIPLGFGESMPVDSNDTEEGRRKNRRVEIHVKSNK